MLITQPAQQPVCASFTNTAEQYVSFHEYWWYRTRRGKRRRLRRGVTHSLLLAFVVWVMLFDAWGGRNALLIAVASFVIVLPFYLLRFRRLDRWWWQRSLRRRIDPESLHEKATLCASPSGLELKAERGRASVEWREVAEVVRDKNGMAIVLWNDQGWVIPAIAFGDAGARAEFEAAIDEFLRVASNSGA